MKVINAGKRPADMVDPQWYLKPGSNRVDCLVCGFRGELENDGDVDHLFFRMSGDPAPSSVLVMCPTCSAELTLNMPGPPVQGTM